MTEFPYAGRVRAALLSACREQIEPDVCECFQLAYR